MPKYTCVFVNEDKKTIYLNSQSEEIKAGEELTANYNLYTYPSTGIGLQMI